MQGQGKLWFVCSILGLPSVNTDAVIPAILSNHIPATSRTTGNETYTGYNAAGTMIVHYVKDEPAQR